MQNVSIQKPSAVLLEVTTKCNLKCSHCYSDSSPDSVQLMPYDVIKRLVIELKDLGVRNVAISGGEPLLHPAIWRILQLLKSQEFNVIIDTNGFLLNESRSEALRSLGVDLVNVSLHGYTPEAHDNLVAKEGSFYRVLGALSNLENAGVPIGINVALNKMNAHEAHNLLYVAFAYKAKAISFFRVFPTGRATASIDELDLSLNEHKEIFHRIKEVSKSLHGCLNIYTELPYIYWEIDFERSYTCGISYTSFVISVEGEVFLCNALRSPSLKCGDISSHSLKTIWHESPIFQSIRNIRDNPDVMLQGNCSTCDVRNVCKGGCRACSYYYYGDLRHSDPRCWLRPVNEGRK